MKRATIVLLGSALLMSGCFLPPPGGEPDPPELAITGFAIQPHCGTTSVPNQIICFPTVSGTVTNSGGPAGAVTIDLSGTYRIFGGPQTTQPGTAQDIVCTPTTPGTSVPCTFTSQVVPSTQLGGDAITEFTVTAVASDGTVVSPSVTASDPLDLPSST